jgi:hypothetical protein
LPHCIFPFEEIGANVFDCLRCDRQLSPHSSRSGPSPELLLRSCSDLRRDDHVGRKPESSLRLWPALDQRPAVETLAWPPERDDLRALSFLDASLEDDEEAFGRGVPSEDRLAGPEIADIEPPPSCLRPRRARAAPWPRFEKSQLFLPEIPKLKPFSIRVRFPSPAPTVSKYRLFIWHGFGHEIGGRYPFFASIEPETVLRSFVQRPTPSGIA